MVREFQGDQDARQVRLAAVVARFNDYITDRLLEGALQAVREMGGDPEQVTVARVPGSVELAVVAKRLAESGEFDAVICLGCVIQGGTDHYEAVVAAARQGIVQAALDTGVPVLFGVLACQTLEQAMERSSPSRNTGAAVARGAIEMARLMQQLPGGKQGRA